VGAVGLVFRAEMRRRWRSWLALAMLIALVGAFVISAVAAGRRTASAFPRFVATHGYNAWLFTDQPAPVDRLADVTSSTAAQAPIGPIVACTCRSSFAANGGPGLFSVPAGQLGRPAKLVAGRWPSPSAPDEVLASYNTQSPFAVRVGTRVTFHFYGPGQAQAALNSSPVNPDGPVRTLRVVGIEAAEFEFPNGQPTSYDLWTTSALARSLHGQALVFDSYFVRLRHGASDIPRLAAAASSRGVLYTQNADAVRSAVTTSIHPQAVGWWVLAVLAGIAGLGVIAQALARQSVVESEDHPILSTLGLVPRQLALLGVARTVAVAVTSAAATVVLAVAASPLTPVGEARVAEPNTGLAVDGLVLGIGAVVMVVVVTALGTLPALRVARLRRRQLFGPSRPSVVVTGLAQAGASPSAVMGVLQALVRGTGRATVPVGTALVGIVVGVTALCAAAVFGASLSHLTTTPALYGDPYQFEMAGLPPGPAGQQQAQSLLSDLSRSRAISRITYGISQQILVNGTSVTLLAGTSERGAVLLSMADGPFPSGDREIALGSSTMRQVHAGIGSTVRVAGVDPDGRAHTSLMRVVSRVSPPADVGTGGLGSGAAMSLQGYSDLLCPPGPGQVACVATFDAQLSPAVLASGVPGPKGAAAIRHFLAAYQGLGAKTPVPPTSLVNFGEAVNFPLILDIVLGIFGAATLVHLLVVSVARRRREIGLLKAIGFLRRQVAGVVFWQATTVALVGIVIGVPLGVAAGKVAWNAFATNLGAVAVPATAVGTLVALAFAVLVAANVLAAAPAWASTRSRPGPLLRTG
jgi:hypothetical protein